MWLHEDPEMNSQACFRYGQANDLITGLLRVSHSRCEGLIRPLGWMRIDQATHSSKYRILVHNYTYFLYDIFRSMICSCSEDMQDCNPSRLNRGTAPLALRDG